ncbi:hypothetical protein ACIBH1_05390 [Nonomuraea sp. NPDC050663]|uniref:hypothetical protein n=1 Tax=Nonomuraea sp. NPDC050663 TaxID=3364370 RepID=UPI00378819B4
MALSRRAQEMAAGIKLQDWSDAPYRADRAGHQRNYEPSFKQSEKILTAEETEKLLWNIIWVTGQAFGYEDPNFDIYEYAEACGANIYNKRGGRNGMIGAGVRLTEGRYQPPGALM